MFALLIPTGSDHDRSRFPLATLSLIGVTLLVYLVANLRDSDRWVQHLGLVATQPRPFQFVTYLFLHAGWPKNFDLGWYFFTFPILALCIHMLFLWFAGSDIEDVLGPGGFLALYFGGGIAAALTSFAAAVGGHLPRPDQPIIGSAGAISALLGFYVIRFPRFKMRVWYGIFVLIPSVARHGIVRITSILFIGLFMLLQVINALLSIHAGGTYVSGWGSVGAFGLGLGFGLATRQSRDGRQEYLLKEADHRFYRQQWHAALEMYKQAAEGNPRCTEAFVKWALCWECAGMGKRAEKVLDQAMRFYLEQQWQTEAATIQKELDAMAGRTRNTSEPDPPTATAGVADSQPRPIPNLLFRKEIKWKGKTR